MPGNNKVKHLNIQLEFKQEDHSYIDNRKKKYISVTTLISKSFPEFDKETIAEKIAIKKNTTKEELLKQWEQKSKEATRLGTRFHQNMEHYIKSEYDLMYKPENILEKIKFDGGKRIANQIINEYKPIQIESQKVIFSPQYEIAGCIDLLFKINDKKYMIFDWKCLSKNIQKTSFNNRTGNIEPTKNILDCNFYHYALQLSLYQNILKSQKYIDENADVQRILIVWNNSYFNFEPTPYLSQSLDLMQQWKNNKSLFTFSS